MTHSVFDGPLPDGWEGGLPVTKYWNGDYVHLYRVTRPCGNCGAVVSLDVSKKALQGRAKNSGLLLRNCPTCRAERKAGGPGSRGGTSRPTVSGPAPQGGAPAVASDADKAELETLRTTNATMKEELTWLYGENKELRERLAKYELGPALISENKMPWQG